MSSCLTGTGGRNYRFDLDIIANSPRSSHSSASSTLSESSNSTPLFISTKRSRGPRKRPNQCSAEAAALLSSIYPKLFSVNHHQLSTSHLQKPPDDPFPLLLPSFPVSSDANLVLHNLPSPAKSSIVGKPTKSQYNVTYSPADSHFQDAGSPDFDAESILDEEVEEGIDSIMGNLSMSKESIVDCLSSTSNSIINPCLANLMGFGVGSRFGFGFGISSNIRDALRQSNDGEWWRSPKVAVKDIAPTLSVNPSKSAMSENKKKKKKKSKAKKAENNEGMKKKVNSAVSLREDGVLKAKLGLKLNYDGVIKEWSGGYPFSGETELPGSAAELIVRC